MVTKMEQYGTGTSAYIFIGTESNIYRIPVQSCSDYTTCVSCIKAKDPYCAFSKHSLSCAPTDQAGDSSRYIQDLENGDSSLCSEFVPVSGQSSTSQSSSQSSTFATVMSIGPSPPPSNGNYHMILLLLCKCIRITYHSIIWQWQLLQPWQQHQCCYALLWQPHNPRVYRSSKHLRQYCTHASSNSSWTVYYISSSYNYSHAHHFSKQSDLWACSVGWQ